MKTILVALDFTPASHNAALYATELARAFQARVILFNAFQPVPMAVSDLMVTIAPDDPEKAAELELKEETEVLDPLGVIEMEIDAELGRAVDTIPAAVAKWQADLVVMGMKGRNKGMRRMFGSTVTSLVGKTPVPLLVVPEEASYTEPKAIALATDADLHPNCHAHVVDALCDIAARFRSKLYVVRIVKDMPGEIIEMQNRPFRLNRIVSRLDPEYVYPHGKDVSHTLNDFAGSHQVTMLAMIAHQHSLFERWFVSSQTRMMTFETRVPLLIVPEIKH